MILPAGPHGFLFTMSAVSICTSMAESTKVLSPLFDETVKLRL